MRIYLPFHLCLILSINAAMFGTSSARKVVMCTLTNWAVHRTGPGMFLPSLIENGLCTHILYSTFGINPTDYRIISTNPLVDFSAGGRGKNIVEMAVNLKNSDPSLKVLATVGGWDEGSHQFSSMVSSPLKRTKFIDSVIEFIADKHFDGLDINWQYPADRGGIPSDKANFVILLKELAERFSIRGLLLTIQLSGKKYIMDKGYDLQGIAKYADLVSFTGYQYNGPWEGHTGTNAPLKDSTEYNVETSINLLLDHGIPASKLVMGMASYGQAYELSTPIDEDTYTYFKLPATAAPHGEWTRQVGILGYFEICFNITREPMKWSVMWDNESSTPFAIKENKFLYSYDNEKSFQKKLELAHSKGLAGAMLHTIDMDDFRGFCGVKFPLLQTIVHHLDNHIITEDILRIREKDNVTIASFMYSH